MVIHVLSGFGCGLTWLGSDSDFGYRSFGVGAALWNEKNTNTVLGDVGGGSPSHIMTILKR